ncbi:MAG: S46 family peptidase [Flavobacteriales bacterium]|nr:S46 family peptidase [Flavobacteriales bacterium]
MFKRILVVTLAIFMASPTIVKADEGMWLPMFIKRLNEVDMQAAGLQLTAEELYSINQSSLKDAIVVFGGFCTGEVISEEGLLLTNHHCAYNAIQSHSSVENDYLTDGFWAMNRSDELANPDLYVDFLIRMEDVSDRVLEEVSDDLSEAEREKAIQKAIKAIKEEVSKDNDYIVNIKSFYEGNEFYMFLYERFQDIRLVGAPPSSVGKYGGDTDNWMWPRHTGDFTLLRIYSAPDGTPASFAAENVPLTKELREKNDAFYHHLPVSLEGVSNEDFTMIWGYPGSTDRYLTSWGVRQLLDIKAPTIVDIRDLKLDIMNKHMDADPKVRIQYASKHARTANYWKYFIGQSKGLKRLGVYEKKQEIEKDFQVFANASKANQSKYGAALGLIEEAYGKTNETERGATFLAEVGIRGTDAVLFTYRAHRMMKKWMDTEDPESKSVALEELNSFAEAHFKNYNAALDQEQFAQLFTKYQAEVSPDQHPSFFAYVDKKFKGSFDKYAAKMYTKSYFTDEGRFYAFIASPNAKKLAKDLAYVASSSVLQSYFGLGSLNAEANEKLGKGNRLFIDGLRKMNPDKTFYPNANFSMRTTFGSVGDYVPADAVHYDCVTTLDGVMEKYVPGDHEFDLPQRMIDLHKAKDYGPYADENGDLIVNFIHNTDITGGNSGSPVINAKGHLVGTAFDGNWEAMSGDIAFEPELQRTISCDIRYVLFIIDKYAGATHLIEEMDLVY